jgi:mRNA-degrading endonuclease RelE of RelBE toxin-antitoxin system
VPGAYSLRIDSGARRGLDRVPDRYAFALVAFIRGPLLSSPRRVGKKLKGELAGVFGARVDDYRIIYTIDEAARVVRVLRIDHRADVYRTR